MVQVVANHAEMMEKLNQFNVIQNSNSLLRSDVEVKTKQLSECEEQLKYVRGLGVLSRCSLGDLGAWAEHNLDNPSATGLCARNWRKPRAPLPSSRKMHSSSSPKPRRPRTTPRVGRTGSTALSRNTRYASGSLDCHWSVAQGIIKAWPPQDLDPQKMVELTETRDRLKRELEKAMEEAAEREKNEQQALKVCACKASSPPIASICCSVFAQHDCVASRHGL